MVGWADRCACFHANPTQEGGYGSDFAGSLVHVGGIAADGIEGHKTEAIAHNVAEQGLLPLVGFQVDALVDAKGQGFREACYAAAFQDGFSSNADHWGCVFLA